MIIDFNLHDSDMLAHTDIFFVSGEHDVHDFVAIDHSMDNLSDAVVIDMSHDEFFDVIDIDTHIESDAFVTMDDQQIFITDFTDEDFNAGIVDFDTIHDFDAL